MKKNIFKKAGRVFTSLALAVSICLTMSVSVFAKNGNDLENKNINYRDYLYFVIDGKAYLTLGSTAGGSYYSNYWIYDPATDLWEGDDLTAFEGSTRIHAVCFSTGTRGIVATGGSGSSSYFDDTWELKPYEYEEE